MQETRARGLRIITDLVLNHTSDQHPWFQAARAALSRISLNDWVTEAIRKSL